MTVRRFPALDLALLLGLALLAPGPAALAAELGDLTIPADRLTDWQPGVEGGLPDTSSWPVMNAQDYGATPNDASNDAPAINAAINAAADRGGFRVVHLPAGVYRFARNNSIRLRSNVVLRGDGPDQTFITGDQGSIVASEWGALHVTGGEGGAVPVSGGNLSRGSSSITLSSSEGIGVGRYLFLFQSNDGAYIQHDDGLPYMTHIFRVTAVSGNSISLDRPLKHSFDLSKNVRVRLLDPITGAGVESLTIMNDHSSPDRYIPVVVFKNAVNCWAKDLYVYNGHHYHLAIRNAARNSIIDSRFERLLWAERASSPDNQYDNYSVSLEGGSVDNLVSNNIFESLYIPVIIARGANGNVFSYNYVTGSRCSNGVFFHGHYPHSNLVEGNDSNCSIMAGDNWWGQQGPYNTVFRNRLRDKGKIKTEDQPTSHSQGNPTIADSFNMLLNSAWSIYGTPFCNYEKGSCRDFDQRMTKLWAERNIARDDRAGQSWEHHGFIEATPEPTTTLLHNAEGQKAPAGWAGLNLPASLYLSGRPAFWPASKAWPGIGADVDDFSAGARVKLPAQDRYESQTPPRAPGAPPTAPVLLD